MPLQAYVLGGLGCRLSGRRSQPGGSALAFARPESLRLLYSHIVDRNASPAAAHRPARHSGATAAGRGSFVPQQVRGARARVGAVGTVVQACENQCMSEELRRAADEMAAFASRPAFGLSDGSLCDAMIAAHDVASRATAALCLLVR